jgi:hypothetical protein
VPSAPYWQLLSVLFSSFPLTPELAATLYEAAFELHSTDGGQKKVAGDAISGTVRNLRKHALIGVIGGPTFEADIETARGKGLVRFLLTRQGLESRGLVDVPKDLRN